jgi:hypothetical protein
LRAGLLLWHLALEQRQAGTIMSADNNKTLTSNEVIERAIAARGDVFPEWRLIADVSP